MINSKKGAELAMNIIIIAAIALIVLVVVIYIFGSKSSEFSSSVGTCAAKFGKCLDADLCRGPSVSGTECEKKDPPQICCVQV